MRFFAAQTPLGITEEAEIASRRSVAATPDGRGSFGCTSGQAFTPAASVQDDNRKRRKNHRLSTQAKARNPKTAERSPAPIPGGQGRPPLRFGCEQARAAATDQFLCVVPRFYKLVDQNDNWLCRCERFDRFRQMPRT